MTELEKLAREIREFYLPIVCGQDTVGMWQLDDYEAMKLAAMLFRNGWRYVETKDKRREVS